MEISSKEVLEKTLERYGERLMKEVSVKYGIEMKELLKMINIEVKEVEEIERKRLSKIPMPFMGVICVKNCSGIKLNHGLYTQCINEKKEENLCKRCLKEKKDNGKPRYGYIEERIELGENYKDDNGKKPIGYGNVMKKLNISRKEVEEEAERLGIKLDEKIFEVKKCQRGRPKKSTAVVDTESECSELNEGIKRGRGRPKKEKKPINEDTSDIEKRLGNEVNNSSDIVKTVVNEVNNSSDILKTLVNEVSNKKEKSDRLELEDEDSEEELAVIEFTHNGVKYLKAGDNTLYDVESHEEVGLWDPKKKKVIEN